MHAPSSDNGRLATTRFHNRKTPLTLLLRTVPCVAPCLCSISPSAVIVSPVSASVPKTVDLASPYLQQPSKPLAKPLKPIPQVRFVKAAQSRPATACRRGHGRGTRDRTPGRSAGMGRRCNTHSTQTRRHLLHLSARGSGHGRRAISRASFGLSIVYVCRAISRCCHRQACLCAPWLVVVLVVAAVRGGCCTSREAHASWLRGAREG